TKLPKSFLQSLKKGPYKSLAHAGYLIHISRFNVALKVLSELKISDGDSELLAFQAYMSGVCYDRLYDGEKAIAAYKKLFDLKIPPGLSDLHWNAARRLILLLSLSEKLDELKKVVLSLHRTEKQPGGRKALIDCLLILQKSYRIATFRDRRFESQLQRLNKSLRAYIDDPRVRILLRIEEKPNDRLDDVPDSRLKRNYLLFREYQNEQKKPGFTRHRVELIERFAKERALGESREMRTLLRYFKLGRGFWNNTRRTKRTARKAEHLIRRLLYSHPFETTGYYYIQRGLIQRNMGGAASPFALAAHVLDPFNPMQSEFNAVLAENSTDSIRHLQAAVEYDKFAGRDARDRARVHCLLGRLYFKGGEREKGLLQFREADRLNVRDAAILNCIDEHADQLQWRNRIKKKKTSLLLAYECLDAAWRGVQSAGKPSVEALRRRNKDLTVEDQELAAALVEFVEARPSAPLTDSLARAIIEDPPMVEAWCLSLIPSKNAPDAEKLRSLLRVWQTERETTNPSDAATLTLASQWIHALVSGGAYPDLSRAYQEVFAHLEKKHPEGYGVFFLRTMVMALEGALADADLRLELVSAAIPNPEKEGVKQILERAKINAGMSRPWFFPLAWGALNLELRRLCLLKLGKQSEAAEIADELKDHPPFKERPFVKALQQCFR
ncbi:MAG: hypothetical protein P1V97_37910, partial [Planctomycetota bacterium]|nr:hypothetical protein [Planctomycetota bacterium]